MDTVTSFIPITITLITVTLILWGADWFLLRRRADLGNEQKFPRQLAMLGLSIVAAVVVVMALPVNPSTRNQVIAFLGLVVSGTLAFSSTTIFANLMAGVMLRITRPFRAGDFIQVNEFLGRVSERGLLDTEIQTETRQLIAIPNTFLITHPVSVVRNSGTVVSVTLSLGYDVHHAKVKALLKEAALVSGLEEPFVHVRELGDFSISYRVNGLLTDVKSLLTARSNLNAAVLDTLHEAGVEIVSPGFMNQRPLPEGQHFIPDAHLETAAEPEATAEQIVFDKAEKAEQRELEEQNLLGTIKQLEEQLREAPDDEKPGIEARLQASRDAVAKLAQAGDASDEEA